MLLTDEEASRLPWRKASASNPAGNCVEVASAGGMVAVRDSKNPNGPVLVYAPEQWHPFLDAVKQGEFDDLV